MKFKINLVYIIIQTIKMLFGYILAFAIVYTIVNLQDVESYLIYSGVADLVLYYFFVWRMTIKITGDSLVYIEEYTSFKYVLKLNEIIFIEIKKKRFYSYVLIKTIGGKIISLFPANPEEFLHMVETQQMSYINQH